MRRSDVRGHKLMYINRVKGRDGKLRLYYRPTGARLPDLPENHPDFIAAWHAAHQGAAAPTRRHPTGTLGAAIDTFLRSDRAQGYSRGYRDRLHRNLGDLQSKYGGAQLSALRQHHIDADLSSFTGHPARARLKSWRALFAWCIDARLLRSDPSAGLDRAKVAKSDGWAPWSEADIAAARQRWAIGTAQRAALELTYWTGARMVDVRGLTRGMVRDGVLTYRQRKTGTEAHVPWTSLPAWAAPLHRDLAILKEAIKGTPFLYLATARGEPRTEKGMSNYMVQIARAAGVDRSGHGLRKSRLQALAEIGGTAHQLMSWCGHASLSEVEHYTRRADRRRAVMGVEQERNLQNTPNRVQNGGAND